MGAREPRPSRPAPPVSPATPDRLWRAILLLLRRLPQGALSRAFGRVADVPIPRRLRRSVHRAFARAVGIDLAEVARPLDRYASINEFFVRRLRPGARHWPDDPGTFGSPVDGVVGTSGTVTDERLLQAKSLDYSLAELLDDETAAGTFEGGTFLTLYLSPRHYHRIHSPCDAEITAARHVPGGLLPVNAPAVRHIPDLFVRNERLVCFAKADFGRIALVAVGAYNVGRISAAFDREWNGSNSSRSWVTNRPGPREPVRTYDPPLSVSRGDELMAFHLGSTVVILVERHPALAVSELRPGVEVRLGQPLIGIATG